MKTDPSAIFGAAEESADRTITRLLRAGYDAKQISRMTGLSITEVQSRLTRIRQEIKK